MDGLSRIEDKVDKIADRVGSIDITLAAQHEVLKDHVRRTEILELEIKPLKAHMNMIQGALKLIGLAATIAGVVEAVVILLEYLRK
jgi:archaellum component FlaC